MGRVPLHDGGFVSWDKVGKKIVGVFVQLKDSKQFPGNKLAVIQTEKGKEALACPTTLENALAGVATGTMIEITFVKEEKAKKQGQSGLKRFEVYAIEPD